MASAAMSRIKERCELCQRMFSINGMGMHKRFCVGETKNPAVPKGHDPCACGRWKSRDAPHCWTCEEKTDFAELDRLIAAGDDTPRAGKKEKGLK